MSKTNAVLIALSVAVLAFIAGYMVGNSASPPGTGPAITEEQVKELPTVAKGIESCPAKGANPAKVVVVEWTDFQ